MKEQVKAVIDKYLNEWKEMGLNLFISTQYKDMIAGTNELGTTWKPIDSTVTTEQLEELEETIRHQLPASFKDFLKYKHFIELHIGEIEFFSHPTNDWQKSILYPVFNGYPTEYLIDKGIMPFANYSDWGHVCFDLNKLNHSAVFLWDHEWPDDLELLYGDFESMFLKLDEQLELENNET